MSFLQNASLLKSARKSNDFSSFRFNPKLDRECVLRIYRKLKISGIEALRAALDDGKIEATFGSRIAQHIRLGLVETETILLYHAHSIVTSLSTFLLSKVGAERVEVVGDYRRNVEVISRFDFLIQSKNFPAVVEGMKRFGGRTALLEATSTTAMYSLSAGPLLCIQHAAKKDWGLSMICGTGSTAHLRKLTRAVGILASQKASSFETEESFYRHFEMEFIPPELRERLNEVSRARKGQLPALITQDDIRGDLHAHTFASDGSDSVEEMAMAAQERGYEYVGITDHTPSLKIANGQSVESLRKHRPP